MRGRAPLSGSPEKCDRSPPAIVAPGAESDSATGAACGPMDADTFVAQCMAQVTPLYRYFVYQIGNVHDAEDLMATTVSKALASITRFDPASGTFTAWLFGIARHTLRDFQCRQRHVSDIAMMSAPLIDSAPAPRPAFLETYLPHLRQAAKEALPSVAAHLVRARPRRIALHRWQAAVGIATAAMLILVVGFGAFRWISYPQTVSARTVIQRAFIIPNTPPPDVQTFHFTRRMTQVSFVIGHPDLSFTQEAWRAFPNHYRADNFEGICPNCRPNMGSASDGITQWHYQPYGPDVCVRDRDGNLTVLAEPPSQPYRDVIWVDKQTYVLLKQERYNSAGKLTIREEITGIEYNIAIPDEVFTYVPAPRVKAVDPRTGAVLPIPVQP